MSFQALLFCQDEKTARVTTQLLTELEFKVETASEPFAAVKRLMAQHFDAVVVDCDNEQNASLLFKGARNSQLNQSSLAVAVVEGQAGVANAFRIGANLVLTKPINVEQAKGTLRVARGLLKKGGESAKAPVPIAPAATPAPAPAPPAPVPAAAAPAPTPKAPAPAPSTSLAATPISKPSIPALPAKAMAAPVMAKPSTNNILDLDTDPAEPAEESLLDIDLDEPKPSKKPELKPSMAPSSMLEAEQVTAKPIAQRPPTAPVLTSGGAAAAPAPAKAPEFEKIGGPAPKPQPAAAVVARSVPAEAPGLFSQRSSAPTFGGLDTADPESSGGAAKYAIIAIVLAALAAAGYFAYTKSHKRASETTAQTEAVSPSSPAAPAEVMPSAVVTAEAPAKPKPSAPGKPSAEVSTSAPHKTESAKAAESEPEVVVKNFETEPRVVKANPTSAAKTKAKEVEAEAEAPSAIGATSDDQSAISHIVSSAPANVPSAAPRPEMLKVSQGVTQGMLLKRVQPVYPHAAMQMRIAGSVQLQAIIDKSGNISSVKVVGGDPILAKAASDAVRQWKYKPYMLDGDAVEIQTQITVNFKLP